MAEQNALVQLDSLGLEPAKYADDSVFALVSTSSSFLPRLMLCSGNSEVCKMGLIQLGRWGIVRAKDRVEDLGAECPFLPLEWRPKALQIGADQIISVYDAKSSEFKRIALKSEEQDSGCMFGPEFLVWNPTAAIPCFTSLFFSSKTARREAANCKALIGRAGLLKCQLIKNKKHTWHGPIVVPCSQVFAVPDIEAIREQIDLFRNPPANQVEAVEAGAEDRAR